MMKSLFSSLVVVFAMVSTAAPAPKGEPVAEGYPEWQGVTAKNYLMGRTITPSDLRHKITIVLEVEPDTTLQSAFLKAGDIAALNPLSAAHFGDNWETMELARDIIFVVSVRGGKTPLDAITAALKPPKDADEMVSRALSSIKHTSVPIYSDLTFAGAPETSGKRPFVYVMGPTGKEPIYQGALGANTTKAVKVAVNKAKKKMADDGFKWAQFYGTVTEPKFYPALAKAIAKDKPLAAMEKSLLKDVVAKDTEKATEAQILYDALNQTRNDLVLRIKLEARECPHRAVYDMKTLVKYWPAEKKKLDDVSNKIKMMPEAGKLAQMFCKLMAWADPNFTCKNAGEAKKIVAELNKMKKDVEKLKESKTIVIQNGALLMDGQIDELISLVPTKVPEK